MVGSRIRSCKEAGAHTMTVPISIIPITGLTLLAVLFVLLWKWETRRYHTAIAWRKALGNTILFGSAVCLGLLTAEGTLRLVDFNPLGRDDLNVREGYYHLAGTDAVSRPLNVKGVSLVTEEVGGETLWWYQGDDFNRYGGRGPEPSETRPDLRVIWMGNSIVFGSNVVREETFPYLVGIAQQRSHPELRIEHVNLAVPGYDLIRYKLSLSRALKDVSADWVILGLWHGDMVALKVVGRELVRADVKVVDGVRVVHSLPFSETDVVAWSKRSRLFLVISALVGNLTVEARYSPVGPTEKMARDLEEIRKLAVSYGTRLALIWFPPLDRPFEEQIRRWSEGRDDHHRTLFTVAEEFSRRNGFPFLDLREAIRTVDVEEIRLDPCCHYNVTGHRRLAETLLPWIESVTRPDLAPQARP